MALHLLAFDSLIISGTRQRLNPADFLFRGNAPFPLHPEIRDFPSNGNEQFAKPPQTRHYISEQQDNMQRRESC